MDSIDETPDHRDLEAKNLAKRIFAGMISRMEGARAKDAHCHMECARNSLAAARSFGLVIGDRSGPYDALKRVKALLHKAEGQDSLSDEEIRGALKMIDSVL